MKGDIYETNTMHRMIQINCHIIEMLFASFRAVSMQVVYLKFDLLHSSCRMPQMISLRCVLSLSHNLPTQSPSRSLSSFSSGFGHEGRTFYFPACR